MLAFSGHFISLIERLSSEMSWMVMKNSEVISSKARKGAWEISVK
jgi:hypothetical protein